MIPLLVLALACKEPASDTGADLDDEPEVLELPDMTGIDFETVFQQALDAAVAIDASTAWSGHATALSGRTASCPDFYAGVPDVGLTDLQMDEPGLSWYDYCSAGDRDFSGLVYWETDISVTGEAEAGEDRTSEATRTLIGDALVTVDGEPAFELDGEATDSVYRVDGESYQRWTWSSEVNGTVTGSMMFDDSSTFPGGWRTDLYIYATGGDADTLSLSGNVYLYGAARGELFADHFDSMAMDLEMVGETGAGPDDCTLEPRGWIGVRDPNAWWYDIVFLPRYDDDATDGGYEDDPYGGCDGCGTLFVRGLEVVEIGRICPDLSGVWDIVDGRVPAVEDYVLSLRELEAE